MKQILTILIFLNILGVATANEHFPKLIASQCQDKDGASDFVVQTTDPNLSFGVFATGWNTRGAFLRLRTVSFDGDYNILLTNLEVHASVTTSLNKGETKTIRISTYDSTTEDYFNCDLTLQR